MKAFVRSRIIVALVISLLPAVGAAKEAAKTAEPLSVVVMDPLALPLSCPCVAGYAQRKYEVLGEYLEKKLGRPVTITFAESIKNALDKESVDKVHLVIGKESVVRAQGKNHKLKPRLLARLVGKDGKTTQTGLIVVRAADPAQTVADLEGYRILFGPPECDEKFAAARAVIEEAGVTLPEPEDSEISHACSDGACMIIDWGDKIRGAAVISSYAAPLLEGCGTIKKGDLRVVGETKPVPFVAAFATKLLNKEEQAELQKALYEADKSAGMLIALETMIGFVPSDFKPIEVPKLPRKTLTPPESTPVTPASADKVKSAEEKLPTAMWPGWLGPERNGRVGWLPHEFPDAPRIVWRRPMSRSGMGGVAATDRYVFVGDRDAANRADVFRCLDSITGDELWTITYPTIGQLDYDNAPRATPLIDGDRVYFFGAFGDLVCAKLETGDVVWRTNLRLKYLALEKLPWGTCSSPLIVDDMIIVNPGVPTASVAALDANTGKERWRTPGDAQGYGSFIEARLGGVRQIVGHTQSSLCGWDVKAGRQLWSLKPRTEGDFNVPTPIVMGDKLLVATENNGGRLHSFSNDGAIVPDPVAVNTKLNPQMSTPIAIGNRVYCVNRGLFCFDASQGLSELWKSRDRSFCEFGAALASDDRLLVQGRGGELLLLDVTGDAPNVVSRLAVAGDKSAQDVELFTFPALVGSRLYVRGEREVICIDLGA
jgi:outer membrane protein assembly factor BamB/ABC-type phosphate/phosphonate transport system substrate-binding protein